jgi:hypothetical protein
MQIVIVSPALADANNGNWRTAQRWTRFLAPLGRVRVTTHWPDSEAAADDLDAGPPRAPLGRGHSYLA